MTEMFVCKEGGGGGGGETLSRDACRPVPLWSEHKNHMLKPGV